MVIISVCSDPIRSARRRDVLHSGRFRVITAQSLLEAWERAPGFEMAAVVIDHEFAEEIGATAFHHAYITFQMSESTSDADLLLELTGLFAKNVSEAVN
jgi:hypothetical protein